MCLDVSGALISQVKQHVCMDGTSFVSARCIVCRYIEYILHVSTYRIEGVLVHMFTTSKWRISASILLRAVSVSAGSS